MMSTTENEFPADPLGRNGLPPKVSRLRWKLIEKAKQEKVRSLYDPMTRPLGVLWLNRLPPPVSPPLQQFLW